MAEDESEYAAFFLGFLPLGGDNAAPYSTLDAVQFSFSITDLKKSVPGATELAALEGEALVAKLREVLGDAARDADVSVEGDLASTGGFSNSTRTGRIRGSSSPWCSWKWAKPRRPWTPCYDVLKVDPRDHQALIILGNHYARVERDLPSAIRFLERAAEIAPGDALVPNSLGAVLFEQKKPQEGLRHFDRALELNPKFASALYGKSILLTHEGRFTAALQCLRSIFEQADLSDARNRPMLKIARDSYLKVTNIVANDRANETFKFSESLKSEVAAESGFPLRIEPKKLPGTLCATTQMVGSIAGITIWRLSSPSFRRRW